MMHTLGERSTLLLALNTAAVTRIVRITAANISSRTRREILVGEGPTKEDNEVMGEVGKRGTVNSSDRRCNHMTRPEESHREQRYHRQTAHRYLPQSKVLCVFSYSKSSVLL
jgi:hypothetical protein